MHEASNEFDYYVIKGSSECQWVSLTVNQRQQSKDSSECVNGNNYGARLLCSVDAWSLRAYRVGPSEH